MQSVRYPLLRGLDGVPNHYAAAVAETKRVLERWTMDPPFRDAYRLDPIATLAGLGVSLTPDHVEPLIDPEESRRITRALQIGEAPGCPDSVLQYSAFMAEKLAHRAELRDLGTPSDPVLAAWRRRQVLRAERDLGSQRADAIVHAPLAIELSEGCSVGCWFCGVSSSRFQSSWPYTENAALWRCYLEAIRNVIGDCASQGFLYWATDPLDNPDYESFIADFYGVLGRCPQTTTALGGKDTERTRAILELSRSLGSPVDRLSILTLSQLNVIHNSFSAMELLQVELVPQNKEAASTHVKSRSGRARTSKQKRANELISADLSSTIACVSGFLINMPAGRVQLITPCDASDDWPLGYWVLDEQYFQTPEELAAALRMSIQRSARAGIDPTTRARLRHFLIVTCSPGLLKIDGSAGSLSVRGFDDYTYLADLLINEEVTCSDVATKCHDRLGWPLTSTYAVLSKLFEAAVFDETPPPPTKVPRS